MLTMLTNYYGVQITKEVIMEDHTGYKDSEYVYFTIAVENKKAIYTEQTMLAYYIAEKGSYSIGLPIPNIYGEWITTYGNNQFIVIKVSRTQLSSPIEHGVSLSDFHRIHATYEYEPQHISSYGQWKSLWIKKLTLLEEKLIKESKKHSNSYYRLVMDVLPYIIGISENAIQYIGESERETKYDTSDAGTITFWRYEDQLIRKFIWLEDLIYDHPARDISEYVRKQLVRNDKEGLEDIKIFMKEYESSRPLSPFGWRLLYGRLIYPNHIFDLLEKGLASTSFEGYHNKLNKLLVRQGDYLKGIKHIFEVTERNNKTLRIPMIQWF